jgi:hypothetical protein
MLHAQRLTLRHPIDGSTIRLRSAFPADMLQFCETQFGSVPK